MYEDEQDFSFKSLFVPLTKLKAIHLIIIIGFIVYFNCLFNGFAWDDLFLIIKNSQIHQFNLPLLLGPNMFNSGMFYRPLQAVYFAFAYSLFGQQAFFYHCIQLALHLVDTSLLFILFCLFFSEELSFFLALLFLVHPINVESVAWISATTNELYFFFGITALLLATQKQLTGKKLSVIISLLFLSVLSKEIGALFIILIIAYRYLFKKNKLKEFTILGIGIGVVYVLLRVFLGGTIYTATSDYTPIAALPLWQRLLHIPAILMFYLKTFFYPGHLSIMQQWTIKTLTLQNFLLPLLLSVTFFLLLLILLYVLFKSDGKQTVQERKQVNNDKNQSLFKQKKSLQLVFFFLWFVIGMGPLLQIVPLDMTVAERFFYFPIVGLLGLAGVGIQILQLSYPRYCKLYYTGAFVLFSLLSLRTFNRTFDWNSDMSIKADAKHENGNYFLDQAYATALFDAGKPDEALIYTKISPFA